MAQSDTILVNARTEGYRVKATNTGTKLPLLCAKRPVGHVFTRQRIEVVRGAAGLVTGTGDFSATVNLVRKRPAETLQRNVAPAAFLTNFHWKM